MVIGNCVVCVYCDYYYIVYFYYLLLLFNFAVS